jgi:manganese efflux pump family protein
MTPVLLFGLLVGLDNVQVGVGLGLVPMSAGQRWTFTSAFAFCETVMPLVGLVLGRGVAEAIGSRAEVVGIAVLAATGMLIAGLALVREGQAEAARNDRAMTSRLGLAGLPLSLSFDNLAAGFGLGSLGFSVVASAVAIGVISGLLCALGIFAGARAGEWLGSSMPRLAPHRAEVWSGVYLVVLAAGRLLWDLA